MKVAPLVGFPGRKLTNSTVRENLHDENTQLRTLLAIEKEFQPDIVFNFMDLSVEAEAVGLKVDFPEDDTPNVIEHPVHSEKELEELENLDFNEIFESSRMKMFANLTKNFKKYSYSELCAYVIGPISFAGLLMSVTDLMLAVISEPRFVMRVLDLATHIVIEYAKRLTSAGANYIAILEPTAMMLSPKQFSDVVRPRITEITKEIDVPAILHICGDTSHLFEEFSKLDSMYGLSLDSDVNLRDAYEKTRKVVIGNINPVMVSNSSKQQVINEIYALTEKMAGVSDFILSTGCDLPPETPLENIAAFRECVSGHFVNPSSPHFFPR